MSGHWMDHWKVYEPIEDVVAFDGNGVGPGIVRLAVGGNTSSDQNYPETRVMLGVRKLFEVSMTVQQSAALRARLEEAEREILAGCPQLANEVLP